MLDTNARADKMIQDAIKFQKSLGYDFTDAPKTTEQVDRLIATELKKK